MTINIQTANNSETSKILNQKFRKSKKNGNLSKHFGKLVRKIDGLNYQNTIRENEV